MTTAPDGRDLLGPVVELRKLRVEDSEELALIQRTWNPRPWAGGSRPLYLRLAWDELTGRRLGSGWTYTNEMPVRRRL